MGFPTREGGRGGEGQGMKDQGKGGDGEWLRRCSQEGGCKITGL